MNTPGKKDGGIAQGSSDESIGRPQPWREGRYQEKGRKVGPAVTRRPKETPPAGPASSPVTRRDYESLHKPKGTGPAK